MTKERRCFFVAMSAAIAITAGSAMHVKGPAPWAPEADVRRRRSQVIRQHERREVGLKGGVAHRPTSLALASAVDVTVWSLERRRARALVADCVRPIFT